MSQMPGAMILAQSEWSVQHPPQWDALWFMLLAVWAVAFVITTVSIFKSRSELADRIVWTLACFVVPIVAFPIWWLSKIMKKRSLPDQMPTHAPRD